MKKLIVLLGFLLVSCGHYYERLNYFFPIPVDTTDKPIVEKENKIFNFDGISFSNDFDCARLNDVFKIETYKYKCLIEPENEPINSSPWYAFKIWSEKNAEIELTLKFQNTKPRYIPKYSFDRKNWTSFDTSHYKINPVDSSLILMIQMKPGILWISAQEIISSRDIEEWVDSISTNKLIPEHKTIGKTKLNRDILFFRIGAGESIKKKVIAVMTRQHPPEISGYLAFKSFIEEILTFDIDDKFFDDYELWVFPNMNPDGVDMGHWRHNSNGVDLNRDWAFYIQPETNIVSKFIVDKAKENKNKVILSLDFHSTSEDIYYIFDNSFHSKQSKFTKKWIDKIEKEMYPFKSIISPEPLGMAHSKTWFYKQFKAESITYEVGDETERSIIDKKARIAADAMIEILKSSK